MPVALSSSEKEVAMTLNIKHVRNRVTPLLTGVLGASIQLGCGRDRIRELIRSGELQSFRQGRRTIKITVASIHDYIARQLAAAGASAWSDWPPTTEADAS
jgi:excisionase family DNA binding protein